MGEESDSIDKLPDELLAKILSGSTIKEAVRTSVLSKRWIDLWKSVENLELDFDNRNVSIPKSDLHYKKWVNGVVSQLEQSSTTTKRTISKFRLAFELSSNQRNNSRFDDRVDRWVEFAISRRVQSLHLELIYFKHYPLDRSVKWHYVFPERCYSRIESLKSLRLSRVEARDEILEHIIANCPFLEELALEQLRTLRKLELVGSNSSPGSPLALKYLELRHCEDLQSVRIDHAPRLERLTYEGCGEVFAPRFRVGECSSLVDMNLGGRTIDPMLLSTSFVSQLKSLFVKVDFIRSQHWYTATYTSLERLTIQFQGYRNYRNLIPFINMCPRLNTLRMFFHTREDCLHVDDEELMVGKMVRESVKVVEIVGFNGRVAHRRFVEYVIECFVGLERIVIDRASPNSYRSDNPFLDCEPKRKKYSWKQDREARRFVAELRAKAAPTLEFVLCGFSDMCNSNFFRFAHARLLGRLLRKDSS